MSSVVKATGSLLLLLNLLGCHQDEPEAVRSAQQERSHQKQLYSDEASLLWAQQELALANAKAASASRTGAPVDTRAQQAATYHVQQAQLQLNVDQDIQKTDEDERKLKTFTTMLEQLQPGGGRS